MLPVIVEHCEVKCIDALEILCIEDMLRAGSVDSFSAKIGLEEPQDRTQYRHARQPEFAAFFLQQLNEILLKQSVEDEARRFRDLRQCMVELFFRSNHRVKMLNW